MNDELKMQTMLNCLIKFIILNSSFIIFLSSCSVQKQIAKSATKDVLNAAPLQKAHVGISIYEPATNKYWYDYQGDKYFVPASNVKIPTCYAAMKYLGDSLMGLRYSYGIHNDSSQVLALEGTGDPTFFHPDFKANRVLDHLKKILLRKKLQLAIFDTVFKDDQWGNGWSWDDYEAGYMAERSVLPVFGNIVNVKIIDSSLRKDETYKGENFFKIFETSNIFFDYLVNYNNWFMSKEERLAAKPKIKFKRKLESNDFRPYTSTDEFTNTTYSISTHGYNLARKILEDTLGMKIGEIFNWTDSITLVYNCPNCKSQKIIFSDWHIIYSQPTDSVLKPMMHRSDNFFAEQTLLMVSNERLGIMNDEKIIDTLLKTDFKDLPQKPGWADGSGLSRYNLFSPKDFVFILNKMKDEFGMEREKVIFPTGGEGTLANYYVSDSNYIYAKTGTLSGVVALSGYLYTKKGKELIFSVLVNNHQASGTEVRRAVEKFLQSIRKKY